MLSFFVSLSSFQVDSVTGRITVRDCPTPGSGNCLDYERRRQYDLTFLARDSFGEGELTTVPLTIRIDNMNDNPPRFLVRNYTSYINEGETIPNPRVRVEVRFLSFIISWHRLV